MALPGWLPADAALIVVDVQRAIDHPSWGVRKPEARPLPGEAVIAKRTNSAFIGTDLEPRLRSAGHRCLVIHSMSLANLDGEYCTVVRTADVLAACGARPAS
jgi:nicotinamidase-related amidase